MVSIKHNGCEIEVDFSPYLNMYTPNVLRAIPWWTHLNRPDHWLRSDGLRFTRGIIKTKKLLTVEQQDSLRKNYLRVSAQYGTAYGFPKNLQAKQALALQSTNYIGEVDMEAPNFSLAKMFEILDRAIPVPRPLFMPGQVWLTKDMTLEMVTQTTVSGNLIYPISDDPCYDLRTEIHKNLMDAVALMYGPSSYGMNIPWVSMEAWW